MAKRSKRFLQRTIEYSFYLFVFLLPWQTKIILRPAATNFNEISLYLSHFLLLVILIAFFIWQLRREAESERISLLWLALAGLELAVLVSFFFAPDQTLAFYHYVLFLMGIGLFYLLRTGTLNYAYEASGLSAGKVITSFFSGIFLHAILGLYQFLTQSTPVTKYLGLAAHDSEQAGTAVIEAASGRWLRAYGGLDHPNVLGGVLAVSLIIAAYLLAQKKMIRSRAEISESILLFIFYFIALAALFFSFSRAAWLAYGVGLLVLLITLAFQKDRWILGRFLALLFFSAVMLFIIAYPYRELTLARTAGLFGEAERLEQKSLGERGEYLGQAAALIKEDWYSGVGTGNYVRVIQGRDVHQAEVWSYQPVHNVFLLLAAQSGIVSALFFLAFLYFLIKKDRRALYSGAVFTALIILMLFDHWLISLPFGVLFLFLILGLL